LLPSLLEVDMASRWYHLVIDAKDPAALARFWAAVLGYQILYEGPGELVIGTGAHDYPGICFVPVPEDKAGKNRLHIDLDPDDRDAEVERILALGARHADVGQGDVSWVVLADPEGNEFCVLRSHRSLVD
jgi:predicted enzyme related to lactoylglutathione lyase